MPIPIETVQAIDSTFRKWPKPTRDVLIKRFQTEQPFLVGYLAEQDRALFPNLPGRVFPIGCLCWNVFGMLGQRHVPIVSQELLIELLADSVALLDRVEEESETRSEDIVLSRSQTHPQPALYAYALRLLQGREVAYEFIPREIKAAWGHADVSIRALDRVVQASPGS